MTRTPTPSQAHKVCLSSRIESVVRKTNTRSFQGSLALWLLCKGGPIELGQVGSADPPLADFCLYSGRHSQHRRVGAEGTGSWGGPLGALPARLAHVHVFSHVRPAVCRQVAEYAKHQRSGVNKDGKHDVREVGEGRKRKNAETSHPQRSWPEEADVHCRREVRAGLRGDHGGPTSETDQVHRACETRCEAASGL